MIASLLGTALLILFSMWMPNSVEDGRLPLIEPRPLAVPAGALNISQFGAKGDGRTDDAPAFRAAFATLASQGGGALNVPKTAASYLIGSWDPTPRDGLLFAAYIPSNVTITGNGTILIENNVYPYVTDGTGGVYYGFNLFGSFETSNITISGLTFDMNGQNNLQPAGLQHIMNTFRFDSGRNVTIQNVTVKNSPGNNMVVFADGSGSGAIIKSSTFSIGGHGIPGNTLNQDFSFLYSEWSQTQFLNNKIIQSTTNDHASGGLEIHGSHSVATGNVIQNCNPGMWIVSSPGAIDGVVVSGNSLLGVARGIAFWAGSDSFTNITIANNTIQVKYNPVFTQLYGQGDDAAGIVGPWLGAATTGQYTAHTANGVAIQNLEIKGNTIYSNDGTLPLDTEPGISLHGVQSALITGNNIHNIGSSGIVVFGSPWGNQNILITRNTIQNFGRNSQDAPAGIAVNTNGASVAPPATAFNLSGMVVTGNIIGQSQSSYLPAFSWQWPAGHSQYVVQGTNTETNAGPAGALSQAAEQDILVRQPVETVGSQPPVNSCTTGDLQWNSGVDVLDGWACLGGAWRRFGPISN